MLARPDAKCGVAQECVATIVDGTEVAHMKFTLSVHGKAGSKPRSTDGGYVRVGYEKSARLEGLAELDTKFEKVDPATAYR